MAAIKQPADQSHFILPDLGEGVHEAELISWKVNPGDSVKEHQTIAEMETDKAMVEVAVEGAKKVAATSSTDSTAASSADHAPPEEEEGCDAHPDDESLDGESDSSRDTPSSSDEDGSDESSD